MFPFFILKVINTFIRSMLILRPGFFGKINKLSID